MSFKLLLLLYFGKNMDQDQRITSKKCTYFQNLCNIHKKFVRLRREHINRYFSLHAISYLNRAKCEYFKYFMKKDLAENFGLTILRGVKKHEEPDPAHLWIRCPNWHQLLIILCDLYFLTVINLSF